MKRSRKCTARAVFERRALLPAGFWIQSAWKIGRDADTADEWLQVARYMWGGYCVQPDTQQGRAIAEELKLLHGCALQHFRRCLAGNHIARESAA